MAQYNSFQLHADLCLYKEWMLTYNQVSNHDQNLIVQCYIEMLKKLIHLITKQQKVYDWKRQNGSTDYVTWQGNPEQQQETAQTSRQHTDDLLTFFQLSLQKNVLTIQMIAKKHKMHSIGTQKEK